MTQVDKPLHSLLGDVLEQATLWGTNEHPEVIRETDRLVELTNAVLAQIQRMSAALEAEDRDLAANAEEFVRNYIVGPGRK